MSFSADQEERWSRALDLAGLAAGVDNDLQACERAVSAVRLEDAKGLLAASVCATAAVADALAELTGEDVHEVLARFR